MNSTTTRFYSSKRNKNVNIPNDKVCGYRIRNEWMKKGYSDGLKAGRDNGVVDQRLSRFAKEYESVNAMNRCKGNVNWLNHKTGMGFRKPESADNQFIFKRPAFKAGVEIPFKKCDSIDNINERGGMGNRYMARPNFKAPDIKGRFAFNPDFVRSMSYGETGLSTTTPGRLSYTTYKRVPDPTDFKWLRERKRIIGVRSRPAIPAIPPSPGNPGGTPGRPARLATGLYKLFEGFSPKRTEILINDELKRNPPLGRPQRTVEVPSDVMSGDLPKNPNINEVRNVVNRILQEIRDGRGENARAGQTLINELARVLTVANDLQARHPDIVLGIRNILNAVRIPEDWRSFFDSNTPQLVDKTWLETGDNKGKLHIFLLHNSTFDPDLTYEKPIYAYYTWKRGDRSTHIQTAVAFDSNKISGSRGWSLNNKSRKRLIIDLHRRAFLNLEQAATLENVGATTGYDPITSNLLKGVPEANYPLPVFGPPRRGAPPQASGSSVTAL